MNANEIETEEDNELPKILKSESKRKIKRSTTSCGEVLSDLHRVVRKCGYKRATRDGGVSKKTTHDRVVVLGGCFKTLHRRGYKVRCVNNLRAEHIRCIFKDAIERNLSPATVATYMTHLRTLCRWIRKPQLHQVIDECIGSQPSATRRKSNAVSDKSASGLGIDPIEIIQKASSVCPFFGCQLALMLSVGLRAQESWMFRPWLIAADAQAITVVFGTKGGRERTVQMTCTEASREVLNWARSIVPSKGQWMIPPGFELRQWRRRFYYLCSRIGLTRIQLGATPHALRHERLNRLYEWLTGAASPVRGGVLSQVDPITDRAARQVIAEVAGHGRLYTAGEYIGGIRRQAPKSDQMLPSNDDSALT